MRQAATAGQDAVQQHCSQHTDLFRKLLSGTKKDLQRHYSQAFVPSRLYPKRHQSSETTAFWGIIGINVATTILAKSDKPEVKELVSQYFKTSVAAVSEGRWYTLLTSSVCHTSVVHCLVNLALLALYRRTQPLSAAEVSSNSSCLSSSHILCPH
jgi:membrane associated rhomboid family serine protease